MPDRRTWPRSSPRFAAPPRPANTSGQSAVGLALANLGGIDGQTIAGAIFKVKTNNRVPADDQPLSRFRGWLDDEFLFNTVFSGACQLGRTS